MNLSRREFLKLFPQTAGCFVATASMISLSACTTPRTATSAYRFPQGVASGDPSPESVVFWTRSVSNDGAVGAIDLKLQVARDEMFSDLILEKDLVAESQLDYTVRCFVDGLDADRHYFYRFLAPDDTASRVGRTRTAPADDSEAPLVTAVCSCQNYSQGFFGAYRRLLRDDEAAPDGRKLDLIIHVGDFIYEREQLVEIDLPNRDGTPRVLGDFPSGAPAAVTLDDYRHLYRLYLSDPDLQEARARFPWINTWDDHEVANDYWQGFTQSGEPMQRRKVAANAAWFEFMPAALTFARPGPAGFNPAVDFVTPEVQDAPGTDFDEDYLGQETNNMAAIGSMTIYRSLGWGRLVDLFAVDGRSYRGPRGVDPEILATEEYPDAPLPAELVKTLNAGRTANNGTPPETVELQGNRVPNSRRDSPRGSLLGAEQKAWLKESLEQSQARWKVICNDVPMMRFGFDMNFRETGRVDDLWWSDSWDGYPLERNELMSFLRDSGITNVVSVTGDRHAHFAGLVYDDFDSPEPAAVIPEFACAGISANCRLRLQQTLTSSDPELDRLVHFNGAEFGFSEVLMPAMNAWLLFGAESAGRLHDTGEADQAMEALNPRVNAHLTYADTEAYGYFVARFSDAALEVEFVTVGRPTEDFGEDGPSALRRVRFGVPAWSEGEGPRLERAGIDGTPPLMGLK